MSAIGLTFVGRIYPKFTGTGLEETPIAPAIAMMLLAAFGLGLLC